MCVTPPGFSLVTPRVGTEPTPWVSVTDTNTPWVIMIVRVCPRVGAHGTASEWRRRSEGGEGECNGTFTLG